MAKCKSTVVAILLSYPCGSELVINLTIVEENGKRYLNGMIFNLAVFHDDDGNGDGGASPSLPAGLRAPSCRRRSIGYASLHSMSATRRRTIANGALAWAAAGTVRQAQRQARPQACRSHRHPSKSGRSQS